MHKGTSIILNFVIVPIAILGGTYLMVLAGEPRTVWLMCTMLELCPHG